MKKTMSMLLLIMGLLIGLFAQDVPEEIPPNGSTVTPPVTMPTGTTTTTTETAEAIENRKLLKELKDNLDAANAKLKEAELAKLTVDERAAKELKDLKDNLILKEQDLKFKENTTYAKSALISEKVGLGENFLPFLNIKHTDTESEINSRINSFKSAVDAHVKKYIEDQTGNFDTNTGTKKGGKEQAGDYGKRLAEQNTVTIANNPYQVK